MSRQNTIKMCDKSCDVAEYDGTIVLFYCSTLNTIHWLFLSLPCAQSINLVRHLTCAFQDFYVNHLIELPYREEDFPHF